MVIFKTIVISKNVFQPFITTVQNCLKHIINELEKIQKDFLGKNSTRKIKHDTLCNGYKAGGLRNVEIPNKMFALQCSLIIRLYDNSLLEWKLIPLYLIENSLAGHLNFIQICSFKVIEQSFFHLSIEKLFCTEKNILLWWLKYVLVFCLNICDTVRISR